MRARTIAASVLALVMTGTLAACAEDPLASQYREGSNKGYIAANGFETREYAPDERGEPIVFTGELDTGETASSADYAGDVVVVNFWYANCGPCIVEAPFLQQVHSSTGAEFLGVNIYDQASTAQSFARDHELTYPSLLAVNDAALKLSFNEYTSLSAVPTTLVLDAEGRLAARIVGSVTEESVSILETIVRDTAAESS